MLSRFVIITGLSGAGKTQALHYLEDLGFFCVDNLPPLLIPVFTELCAQSFRPIEKVAVVVDIRGGEFFEALSKVLRELEQKNFRCEILYLEASDNVLIQRYKESRRTHPLSKHGEILKGIQEERLCLQNLRGRAHKIIDTSNISTQLLKKELAGLFSDNLEGPGLHITIISFGYKFGIPLDSDLVFDVRFLPNPHYEMELKPLTGEDAAVREYVFNSPVSDNFTAKFFDLINFLLPEYIKEGKTSLTIAIGCTGGRHRSVAVAEKLGECLKRKNYRVTFWHRDVKNKNSIE
ncbi:MAG TPA: RNase adapter RapZ [Desulfotomaculum sp.]|nr:RNase adapter RapZ [Desulfotomaculum sp.]